MEDYGSPQELRKAVLRAGYEIGMNRTGRLFSLAEVAGSLGVDDTDEQKVRQLAQAVQYLHERGWLKKQTTMYEAISITIAGIDEVEGNNQSQQPPTQTTNINISGSTVNNSILGNQGPAEITKNINFNEVERQIERDGEDDRAELYEALAVVRRLVEEGDQLDRGELAKFSDVMQRNSWITGPFASALLGFGTQAT